jgi:hypothetical protein
MSNLFSYFQRIEPKKMAATQADNESTSQTTNTPKTNTNNGHTKKSQTPKEARKPMNMSDVYSADSPKPEKRKQSSTIPTDDHDPSPKTKSEIIIEVKIINHYFII